MLKINDVASVSFMDQAERGMAAFLRAAVDVVGKGGLERASDLWIHAMESLDGPIDSPEKFFRSVTIRAAAQLLEYSQAGITNIEKAPQRRAGWMQLSFDRIPSFRAERSA